MTASRKFVKEDFFCPISFLLFKKPVALNPCKHNFESKEIMQWKNIGKKTCPCCRAFIKGYQQPSKEFMSALEYYKKNNPKDVEEQLLNGEEDSLGISCCFL